MPATGFSVQTDCINNSRITSRHGQIFTKKSVPFLYICHRIFNHRKGINMASLLYQGHSSFRLISDSGLVFYIDPYAGGGYDIAADVILVTHQHFDHNRIDLVTRKDDCTIITNAEALVDGEYNEFEIGDVYVEAVPAYNKNHDRNECVGYMIQVDGRTLYFTGDTGITEEMSEYPERKIGIIFVPMDGVYTMDTETAKQCTEIVKAEYCIPVHTAPQYQKPDDQLFDLQVAESFMGEKKVIVKPGENIVL